MSIRTDMAAESFSQAGGAKKLQGVKVENKVIESARLEVTDITIETQEAAEKLGRPVGRYITLTATDSTFDMYSDSFRERAEVIAKAIGELCGGCERFLAVGLGNYALTSDAVGPLTAEKIFATRHIKSLAKEIDTDDLGEVTVIQTGVLGNTGIESSEQVKAIAERVRPQAVIAVDALACSELSNLGRTIQLCDTGISPGSGKSVSVIYFFIGKFCQFLIIDFFCVRFLFLGFGTLINNGSNGGSILFYIIIVLIYIIISTNTRTTCTFIMQSKSRQFYFYSENSFIIPRVIVPIRGKFPLHKFNAL